MWKETRKGTLSRISPNTPDSRYCHHTTAFLFLPPLRAETRGRRGSVDAVQTRFPWMVRNRQTHTEHLELRSQCANSRLELSIGDGRQVGVKRVHNTLRVTTMQNTHVRIVFLDIDEELPDPVLTLRLMQEEKAVMWTMKETPCRTHRSQEGYFQALGGQRRGIHWTCRLHPRT